MQAAAAHHIRIAPARTNKLLPRWSLDDTGRFYAYNRDDAGLDASSHSSLSRLEYTSYLLSTCLAAALCPLSFHVPSTSNCIHYPIEGALL